MNKSKINELSAETEADSNSTAQNQQVSQPNANTNVVGSREIKFRAWDYFNDVMIYDSDDETDFKFYNGKSLVKYVTEQHAVENGIDIDRPIWNQVDGPVMQFTGREDAQINGNEVYECDIIENCDTKELQIVYWNEDKAAWYCRYVYDENRIVSLADSLGNLNKKVGNIFENHELLETFR
jgi:hypothetical protein